MILRPAAPSDHPAILALWNPLIRETTITFSSEEKTPQSLSVLIAARRESGQEFLICEADGVLLGFATYAQFRGGNGYVRAMEHTIVLAEAARGRGIGRLLMTAIEDHARRGGAHTLFAGVSGENPAAVAFHEAMGFRALARIPEVGFKFGRWLDLVLLMKFL